MAKKNRTKDEIFVLSLGEEAELAGDPEAPVDRYKAGARANLTEKAVNTICKLLIQANFIKKSGESNVYLTPHGLKLIERLRLE